MNDWPANPKLDASLRRLVNAELAAAQTDVAGLSRSPVIHRSRGGRTLAGLGALAGIAIVASLAVRGANTGRSSVGGAGAPSASGSSGSSDATASASPSPTPTHTPTLPASGSFTPTGSMTTSDNGTATLLADGRVLIVGERRDISRAV